VLQGDAVNSMDNRERFRAAMRFEATDRPCQIEHGFWTETYERWRHEGLPETVAYPELFYRSPANDMFEALRVTKLAYIRLEQYYVPAFEPEIISETEGHRLRRDERGVVVREKIGNVSMPQFLDYPIKGRNDYHALRDRLLGSPELRFPADWEAQACFLRSQTRDVLGIHLDGFFAYPRELLGVERLLITLHDDPDLIQTMIGDRVEADIALYERAIEETRPDFAFIWEDMCFKNGPLLSPTMFRRFMLPAYQKLTAFLRRMGIRTILVDSDGNVSLLIRLWLEGGVTGLLPFEVRAGMDVRRIRAEYPGLQIIGGIEKHRLECGYNEIDAELARVLPTMLRQGGYCPSLDHWVHSEIPLSNFQYYVARVRNYSVLPESGASRRRHAEGAA
jgi:uroporphyrinogen decarboxylase